VWSGRKLPANPISKSLVGFFVATFDCDALLFRHERRQSALADRLLAMPSFSATNGAKTRSLTEV